jgi:hypothetical protein
LVNGHLSLGKREKEEVRTKQIADRITPLVQRQAEEEEEEEVQAKLVDGSQVQRQEEEEEEEEEPVQAKLLSSKPTRVTTGLQSQIQSIRDGGQPLPQSTRAFFEPRFGRDFSRVRLHNDSPAAGLARSVNAKAFTVGSDVVFGSGQYSPGTHRGKSLLAHELTHVLQQNGGASGTCPRLQRAVKFKSNFKNVSLSQSFAAAISGTDFTYSDADFSADADIVATGDTEAELNQWDVGILQDMVVNWEREYWPRNNVDRKGRFVEQKFKKVNKRFRDQEDGATTDWSADSEHQLLSGLTKTPKGGKFQCSTTINTSDFPGGEDTINGSDVQGMDASDGTRNIRTQRIGTRFDTYISAHNTVTGAWRHLRRQNWNYQRSLDFTGSGATLAVGPETGKVGKHGPYSAGKHAPLLSGTTANDAMGDDSNWHRRRVKGWP